MQKAQAAVNSFLSKNGQDTTTVHETVNPAIQNEHVTKTHHEDVQKVVDREVHQDHYHLTKQEILDKEVLPEQHRHNQSAVQEKEYKHGDDRHVAASLAKEREQFQSTKEVGATEHSTSRGPTLTGEHVHHHIHETIQPVINKETVQQTVQHTTIPIHEVHYNEAEIKPMDTLPPVTLAEYQNQEPTSLRGKEHRDDAFAGQPKDLNDTLNPHHDLGTIGGHGAKGSTSLTGDLESQVGPNRGNIPAQSLGQDAAGRSSAGTGAGASSTSRITGPRGETSGTTATSTSTSGTSGAPGLSTTSGTNTSYPSSTTNNTNIPASKPLHGSTNATGTNDGLDLGDKLHGKARNRGVDEATGEVNANPYTSQGVDSRIGGSTVGRDSGVSGVDSSSSASRGGVDGEKKEGLMSKIKHVISGHD